jgi:ketosteroid isomerase-like protein
MQSRAFIFVVGLGIAVVCRSAAAGQAATPSAAVEELLAADRAFSKASASTDVITGLSAMFADEIVMMVPRDGFAEGKAKATAALRSNPDNATSRLEWTPIRGGISADGLHGFTFGFMTMHKPDKTEVPMKYLAYWIKKPEGWRVAALKRRPRPAGAVSLEPMAPALPARLVPPSTDAAVLAAAKSSLEKAEKDFSDEAQKIGIGPAFVKWGRADAINMGGPQDAGFVVGSAAIGGSAGPSGQTPEPSPLSWDADKSFVASSGDLGINFGMIRQNKPVEGRGPIAFFTIWWRPSASEPWRYIAE